MCPVRLALKVMLVLLGQKAIQLDSMSQHALVVNSKAAPAGVPANTAGTATVSCNTTTQFMLTSSFNVAPSGSPVNKPFVQYKSLILDATNKYPVGVTYGFLQSVSGGSNYDVYAQAVCCTK